MAALLLVGAIALRWLPGILQSLWLDETITFWVIKDGLAELLHRTVHFQFHPAYYILLKGWTLPFGHSELALRLLSTAAVLATLAFLYRLGTDLDDRETGWIAVVVFASLGEVAVDAKNARPYALATLLVVVAAWSLARWLRSGERVYGWIFGLSAAAIIHAHLLFTLVLPAYLVYALVRLGARETPSPLPWRATLVPIGLIALGGLAYLPVLDTLIAHRNLLNWLSPPTFADLVSFLLPLQVTLGLAVGLLATLASRPSERANISGPRLDVILFVGLWMLLPTITLFSLSIASSVQLFDDRSLGSTRPALALLVALLVRRLPRPPIRWLAVVVIVVMAFGVDRRTGPPADDFRRAAEAIDIFSGGRPLPIFYSSYLIEARNEEWLAEPDRRSYIGAPFSYYRLPSEPIITPQVVSDRWRGAEAARRLVAATDRFAVVQAGQAQSIRWFEASAIGFLVDRIELGNVRLALFVRETSLTDPPVEATSLLGYPLVRPELPAEFRAQQEALLATARRRLATRPDEVESSIWVGRRTAYLGRYRESIAVYSEALERFPNEPRLYRHRGHRYITLRRFDEAIEDLVRAGELVAGVPDGPEPDGLPNEADIPTSTHHSNIWYHLGLAHYLEGDFVAAERAYRSCLEVSTNPDMLVATSHWLYMTLRRLDRPAEAAALLAPVTPELKLLENHDYHRLLLMYKGELDPEELLEEAAAGGGVSYPTVGYGVGNWHLVNGDHERADEVFRRIVEGESWAAFGFLAAEAELARTGT